MTKKYFLTLFLFLSALSGTFGQCPPPTMLTVSNITGTSAAFGWNSNGTATQWEILVLPANAQEPTPNNFGTVAMANPYIITGLIPCSGYKSYVRTICSPGVSSPWTPPFYFNTASAGGCTFSVTVGATQTIPTSDLMANVSGGTPPYSYQWIHNGAIIQGATANTINVLGQSGQYNVIVTDASSAVVTASYFVQAPLVYARDDAMTIYPNSNSISTSTLSILANDNHGADQPPPGTLPSYMTITITSPSIPSGFSINPTGTINVLPGTAPGTYTIPYQICSNFTQNLCSSAIAMVTVANEGFLLNAFIDTNNNSVKDPGELPFNHGQFRYQLNNTGNTTMVFPSNGIYYIQESNASNTYDFNLAIDPQYSTFYSVTASYNDVSYAAGSGVIVYNFPVTELPYTDASVILLPNGAPPRPGFSYSNRIAIRNLGNQPITSGTITFTKDSRVALVSTSEATAVTNANGFSYTFANLLPNEIRYINVIMSVPTIPTINLNDILTNTVAITGVTGDAVASNNNASLSQIVVGSYDPNDKTESHGGKIVHSSFTSNDYLTYTIQFENTGTYQAENVRINDVLDAKLDETSIKMINASHSYTLTRVNNNLNWNFNGIDLAPSGKGAVTFQIKPKPGYALGDIIPNTASIYFDFNPAIVTNTYNTEFVNTMSVSEFGNSAFLVYPNPTRGLVFLSSKDNSHLINSVIVTDILGKTIQTKLVNTTEATIDLSDLSSGIYFAKVKSDNSESVIKIVKH